MVLVVAVVVVIYTIINFKRLSVTQAVLVMGWLVTVGVVKVVDTHYGSLLPVVEVHVFTHADVSMTTYRVDIY